MKKTTAIKAIVSSVSEAIKEAWKASDVGTRDLVTQPHEEGGWIYMNLIDGRLSIKRGPAKYTNAFQTEPAPQPEENNVLVASFHTHPIQPRPSNIDMRLDAGRGLPNLVACPIPGKTDVYQILPSGPPVRKHLASKLNFPGIAGGDGP